jgi:hypothetical protein
MMPNQLHRRSDGTLYLRTNVSHKLTYERFAS